MNCLQLEIGEWGIKTFGENQTPEALINHIKKEVNELADASNLPHRAEECADILILLFGVAHRSGFDLIEEVRAKFEIVKRREWNEPDADGVIEHKKVI